MWGCDKEHRAATKKHIGLLVYIYIYMVRTPPEIHFLGFSKAAVAWLTFDKGRSGRIIQQFCSLGRLLEEVSGGGFYRSFKSFNFFNIFPRENQYLRAWRLPVPQKPNRIASSWT